MNKILFIFGTRPEAIKMAPLIAYCKRKNIEHKVCVTAQHRQMLDQVLDFFSITPDYDLNIMQPNQTLFDVTSVGLKKLENVFNHYSPDLSVVQGDTTTAMVGALGSFYNKIKIAHIEAGLRSGNKYSPFPEEVNRTMIGHMADYHFTPTNNASLNLNKEGITKNVWMVGNTVIDALFLCLETIKTKGEEQYHKQFININFEKKIVLITAHRRENFGVGFNNICESLRELSQTNKDLEFVFPVHLNPNVQEPVNKILKGIENIKLMSPLEYPYLVWIMNKSHIVLTDSGGIQEEAPSLGKPVLVLREVTERTEGIEAGTAILVGTEKNKIIAETQKLIDNKKHYTLMSKAINPYGDGKSSEKIFRYLE